MCQSACAKCHRSILDRHCHLSVVETHQLVPLPFLVRTLFAEGLTIGIVPIAISMCQVPPIGSQKAPSSSRGGNASISTSPIPIGPAVRDISFSKKTANLPHPPLLIKQKKNAKRLFYAHRSTFLAHKNFKIHDNAFPYQSPVVAIKQYINLIYLYPGAESFSALSLVSSLTVKAEKALLPLTIWTRASANKFWLEGQVDGHIPLWGGCWALGTPSLSNWNFVTWSISW